MSEITPGVACVPIDSNFSCNRFCLYYSLKWRTLECVLVVSDFYTTQIIMVVVVFNFEVTPLLGLFACSIQKQHNCNVFVCALLRNDAHCIVFTVFDSNATHITIDLLVPSVKITQIANLFSITVQGLFA